MRVEFLDKFSKDLDKIKEPQTKSQLVKVILNVESASKLSEIQNLKKLKGYKNAFRVRIGNYRVGLFIEKGIAQFARVVHRKEIYKRFP